MNKRQFDLKKQMLFVYMRRDGRCAICGGEVSPHEVATDREITTPLPIDDLLAVQLVHPFCKARASRSGEAGVRKAA